MLEAAGAGVRPLTTIAIADAAIEHLRDDPVLYYGIVAPAVVPLAAVALYFADLVSDYRGDPLGYAPRVEIAAVAISLLLHLRFVAQGAVAWTLERKLRGLDSTIAGAWGAALRRMLPLTLAGIVFWVAVGLGVFLAGIPSIVAVPLLSLGPAVAMIEEKGAVATIFRTVELGWRETARALQLLVVLALGAIVLGAGVAYGITGLLELAQLLFYVDVTYLEQLAKLSNPIFLSGVIGGTLVLIEPAQCLVYALLYVDRRVRTEAFDLKRKVQLLLDAEAERLRASSDAAAVEPAAAGGAA